MNVIIKIFRIIASFILVPACVAFTISFYSSILKIRSISESSLIFILGALTYSIMHLLLFKLDFLYVLGHEIMHAIATLFSGGKASGMKVSSKKGSVKTTTPNFFVILAPYLAPAYTVFIAIVYFILSFFMDVSRYLSLFMFLTGFTLMFHLAYTSQSIRDKQSDLIKAGYIFSISLVYIINLTIVFCIVSFMFKEASFFDFLSGAYEKSKHLYFSFWKQLFL